MMSLLSVVLNYDYCLSFYLIPLFVVQIPIWYRHVRSYDLYVPRPELKTVFTFKILTSLVCLISMADSFTEKFVFKEVCIVILLTIITVKLVSTKHLRLFFVKNIVISTIYMVIFAFVLTLPFVLYVEVNDQIFMFNRFLSSVVEILSISYLYGGFYKSGGHLRNYFSHISINYKILLMSSFGVLNFFYTVIIINIPFITKSQANYDLTNDHKVSIFFKLVTILFTYSALYLYVFHYKNLKDFRGFSDDPIYNLYNHHDIDAEAAILDEQDTEHSNIVSIEKFYIVSSQDLN